ncbi:elongation factor P hydroxylase [Neptunomonas sp.]|uniref:elongation factor P hydroxylase n=1 Tax=Neptunomonas sp. TaxID=1971898 RepID=UPI00356714E2
MSNDTFLYQDLIALFDDCFASSFNTRLVKGSDEPVYLPASGSRDYHAIYFAHGYFSSALHEISHWLIAGEERRKLEDFGYWYVPDGRTAEQQALFEQVEIKPQAIEWILSTAAGYRFYMSADNLNGEATDASDFRQAVYQQVIEYSQKGLPERAEQLRKAISHYYQTPDFINVNLFDLSLI